MVSPAQSKLIEASLLPAAISRDISSAVAKKSLDATKQEGAAVLKLLDSAAGITAGDPQTAKATGLGGMLDIVG
jgi:hypothetical protein